MQNIYTTVPARFQFSYFLEATFFRKNSREYFNFLFTGAILLLVRKKLIHYLIIILKCNNLISIAKGISYLSFIFYDYIIPMSFLSHSFSFMILYFWAKSVPTDYVLLFGFTQVRTSYYPWIFLVISWLLWNIVSHNLIGFAVGHILFQIYGKPRRTQQFIKSQQAKK